MQIQLILFTRIIFEATKLDKQDGVPEKQYKVCLNDQATIAWFTSTRGVYQVGFLAYKLYSGLMRVHFIEYLWWNIFALCKIFFVLKYFRNNFYNTQVKKNHLRIVRPTLEIVEKCIIHIRICFWNWRGSGPVLAVLQCQVNPWQSRSKLLNSIPF